ncbi:hypothetical protein TVAG_511800 [Trichomonas vaginalis G3]|uniref:Uncharacterized protein n=1 Tax=Trichomonas vaginalis (strain ATCC PRA-98 / G3) TaxID=412133 RepID=A2GCY1_TRIV3|nr:hypothetical protein TVAGG3_0817280 [Trichomonas vaginalis G3]EAX84984.1 hypothetical protein TVAG_511800 [Trichomonas vaginalis G3]KAI5497619.1 hypothetical protein TVAGG3_0817280 [Trichomonas vaginalis G3]|eukprot:XP_001297914.1 hypothetical protein [Trichomonas vaginalis G3]
MLPFKPMILNHFPRFSACINAFLSICPHITACFNSFPLVKYMISSQITENLALSNLFSIFPNNFADTDIRDDVICFVTQFCNECGFELEILNNLPGSKVESENDPDIIVCLPESSEKSLVEEIIAIPKRQYYKIISIILEENGVLYTNVNTNAGSFKISNNGIVQTDHFTKSSDLSEKYIALIYVRSNIYDFVSANFLWPHPIVKNPDLLQIEQKSLVPVKVEPKDDCFYFSYDPKHDPYPSTPSRFVRSHYGILMPVQPKGQLIWCQELNKDPYPKYFIGEKMKVSEIIKNSEISNAILVKMSGKFILSAYKPLEDEEIQFPTENLLVIEKHKSKTIDTDKKKTYFVSYAKQKHVMNTCAGNPIESSILQYNSNPQVFESLIDALEYSKIEISPNRTGFSIDESDSSYIFIVNSKLKFKKSLHRSNDFYNLNYDFVNFVVVQKLQNSTNKKD